MPSQRKGLTIEEVLRLSSFSTFYGRQFDMDDHHQKVVVSVRKPLKTASIFSVPFLDGNERGSVWCFDLVQERELQFRLEEGVGAFSPRWSPNCTQVVFCITNGEWVRLAVGDPSTGEARTVCERDVWLRPGMAPVAWLDERTIVSEVLESGTKSVGIVSETASAKVILKDWPDAWKGSRSTAGMVRTLQGDQGFPVGTLVTVDVPSGRVLEYPEINAAPSGVAAFGHREREVPHDPDNSGAYDMPADELIAAGVFGDSRLLCRSGSSGTFITLRRNGVDVEIYRGDEFLNDCEALTSEVYEFEGYGGAANRFVLIGQRIKDDAPKRVILNLYPGFVVSRDRTRFRSLNNVTAFNPYLLASMGFTVVRPEIDLSTVSLGMVAQEIEKVVSRCVAQLVDHHNVDGSNIHVFGQSMGGWAALLMATRTSLFRSAIACSAATNLISLHGEIDVRSRYGDDFTYMSRLYESVFKLSGPPWRELASYVEHSPLFGIEAMNVPALLVHGDLDYVPISQAEEFMSAMEYCGKDARLLRLAGEGHVMANPHNMRAFATTMKDWLSEHSR